MCDHPDDIALLILLLLEEQLIESLIVVFFFLSLRRRSFLSQFQLLELAFPSREYHRRSVYIENWIDLYLDMDFYMLFRMQKTSFYHLLNIVMCPDIAKVYKGGEIPVAPEKSLLITLWWLGKGDTLNCIADRFDVSPSTAYHYAGVILERLVSLLTQFISWPNEEECTTTARQFREICGYPGVIGAIDGCNIQFKAPLDQQDSYIDKNSNHSMKIQAIVTANRIFTNINVGFPGSVHDSRIFSNSQLFVEAQGNLLKYFPLEDYHLLGDKAYPLLGWLLTPFKDYGNLDGRKRIHNFNHSKTRIKVEHTFGILKGRWRILKYINVNCPKKAAKIIVACCILHNFCYQNLDEWTGEVDEHENLNDDYDEMVQIHNENPGIRKREEICNLFI